MDDFDGIVAAADAAVTSALGGPVEIRPQSVGRFGAGSADDPSRTAATVRGVYGSAPKVRQPGQQFQSRVAGTDDTLWISADEAEKLGFEPVQGDLVTVRVRGVSRTLRITLVTSSDQGGYDLLLSEEIR